MGASIKKEKKKNTKNVFRSFLVCLVFLVVGIGAGIYGMTKYLDKKEEEKNSSRPIVEEGPKDITNDSKYTEKINSLSSILTGNPIFYSTKGLKVETWDNNSKLTFIYTYLIGYQKGKNETLSSVWWGATTCANDFITDPSEVEGVSSNQCTITRFNRKDFTDAMKKLFNTDVIDNSVEFKPMAGRKCVIDSDDNNSYICGDILDNNAVTGFLESKFTIQKVTLDEETGTIVIYDKGYLVDNRSNVGSPNDGYDNYYLHSSDSKDYYYELKSADNLTFKHTFKTDDRENYYYVSSELNKE